MRILVTGGTGFIGSHLVDRLVREGHVCTVLVRTGPGEAAQRKGVEYLPYARLDEGLRVEAVINLAGESVAGRWTAAKKRRIMESRVEITRRIVDWIERQEIRPELLISSSAVGIYGHRPGEILTEASSLDPCGRFRYRVCRAWEEEARRAETYGVRTVLLRTGNVLDPRHGFLGRLLPYLRRSPILIPFAPDSYLSWIALPDAVAMILFALRQEAVSGPLNVTAPHPVTIRQFVRAIGDRVRRPVFGEIPKPIVRLVLGEFSHAVLDSQEAVPEKAEGLGFRFEYPGLEEFLRRD